MEEQKLILSYVLDRMTSVILGRPPGISDDDIDIDLPDPSNFTIEVSVNRLRSSGMSSAVHYIKLKQIVSSIQRAVYTVSSRNTPRNVPQAWAILDSLQKWENEIPQRTDSNAPCCSLEWFQLRGVEARLQLLRALCTGEANVAETFLGHLAANAARGCELQ